MRSVQILVSIILFACGSTTPVQIVTAKAPEGKTFMVPGQTAQAVATSCIVAADGSNDCARPDYAECVVVMGSGSTKVCLYQPCTPNQSVCPTTLPVCDATVSYCRRNVVDRTTPPPDVDGGAVVLVSDAGVRAQDGGAVVCSVYCPPSNMCVVNVTTGVVTCIPPEDLLPVPDGGASAPDAGTQALADGGVVTPGSAVTGVITPVPASVAAPVVPIGARSVLRIILGQSYAGRVVVWSDPANWSNPQCSDTPANQSHVCVVPITDLGVVDSTIWLGGQWDFDYGANGQTALQVGYNEVALYFSNGDGMVDLLRTAITCEGKLKIPVGRSFDPPACP